MHAVRCTIDTKHRGWSVVIVIGNWTGFGRTDLQSQVHIKTGYDVEFPVHIPGKSTAGYSPGRLPVREEKAQSVCCWSRFGGAEVQHEASRDFVQILIIAEPKNK
jgi:hypothetical protein